MHENYDIVFQFFRFDLIKGEFCLKVKPCLVILTIFKFTAKTKVQFTRKWCVVVRLFQNGKVRDIFAKFMPNISVLTLNRAMLAVIFSGRVWTFKTKLPLLSSSRQYLCIVHTNTIYKKSTKIFSNEVLRQKNALTINDKKC